MAVQPYHGSHSPSRQRKGYLPHITESGSIYSTVNSVKTPSIVELENLRIEPSQEFIVETTPTPKYIVETTPTPNSLTYRHVPSSPKKTKTFKPHPTPRWEGREKTTVYVSVTFLKIGEIETIKEYFEADVYIQAKWREPLLDKTKTNVSDFKQFWNPELVLQNVFEDPKEQIWHEVRRAEHGEAYIYEIRRVKGKFYETMELNEFPFDVQGISVVLSSELTKDALEIVEDKDEISTIYVDCFSDSQEWEMYNFVEMDPLDISSQYTRARINYPGVTITCCVSRRSGFFAWNVLVIVNLLSIFAFTTFAVDPTLPQNRLQLSFILMLAAISFRFVTNQSIPKISYLTHLDRYVLVSMMFSGFITFWHAILSRFKYDTKLQSDMDFYAFIVFAVCYFLFQMVFILVMLYQRQKKLNEIRTREKKYRFKVQNVAGDFWHKITVGVTNTAASSLGLRNKSNIHSRPR